MGGVDRPVDAAPPRRRRPLRVADRPPSGRRRVCGGNRPAAGHRTGRARDGARSQRLCRRRALPRVPGPGPGPDPTHVRDHLGDPVPAGAAAFAPAGPASPHQPGAPPRLRRPDRHHHRVDDPAGRPRGGAAQRRRRQPRSVLRGAQPRGLRVDQWTRWRGPQHRQRDPGRLPGLRHPGRDHGAGDRCPRGVVDAAGASSPRGRPGRRVRTGNPCRGVGS